MIGFQKMAAKLFLLWLIPLGLLIYQISFHPLLRPTSSKHIRYRTSKESKIPEIVFQKREGVSKDVWLASKDHRTYCHLESPFSTLEFIKEGESPKLIESLTNVKVWLQQPISGSPTLQEVRYLKAKEGRFNYSTHILSSDEALFSAYKISPSSEAHKTSSPTSTIFSFLAKHLSVNFDDYPISFSASGFSAHLQSEGSL